MAVKGQAQLTVVDLTDGYTVNMTRDSYIFTGDDSGNVAATETFTVKISALQGSTSVACSVTTSNINLPSAGLTVSSDGDATSPTLTFTATTSLTASVLDSFGGLIAIPVLVNSDVTITKGIAIAVAEKGTTGTAGTAAYNYQLLVSPSAVVKAEDGTLKPTTIALSSTRGQGTGTPAAYSGRFKIEAYDGSNWTTKYTASSNASSYTYTVPSGYTLLRCSLYLAGGTTTLLDTQTVPIVSDGDTGAKGDAGYTVVLSNESHTFAAGVTAAVAGTATTTVLAYQGSTAVAATIGTISGQVTGLTTDISNNSTTSATVTITVTTSLTTKSGVLTIPITVGSQTFTKYFSWSLSYKGEQGIQGIQGEAGEDAVVVAIATSNGTVFKNNSGSTILTAYVYVGGTAATISSAGVVTYSNTTLGTIYWYKNGTKVSNTGSQTLTVSASDITDTAVYTAQLEA